MIIGTIIMVGRFLNKTISIKGILSNNLIIKAIKAKRKAVIIINIIPSL
jgi:hypothetical protein